MRFKCPFVLFKKTLRSGKKVWYYYFYDEYNKRHQFSTGCTIKAQAEAVCMELYRTGAMIPTVKHPLALLSSRPLINTVPRLCSVSTQKISLSMINVNISKRKESMVLILQKTMHIKSVVSLKGIFFLFGANIILIISQKKELMNGFPGLEITFI